MAVEVCRAFACQNDPDHPPRTEAVGGLGFLKQVNFNVPNGAKITLFYCLVLAEQGPGSLTPEGFVAPTASLSGFF